MALRRIDLLDERHDVERQLGSKRKVGLPRLERVQIVAQTLEVLAVFINEPLMCDALGGEDLNALTNDHELLGRRKLFLLLCFKRSQAITTELDLLDGDCALELLVHADENRATR